MPLEAGSYHRPRKDIRYYQSDHLSEDEIGLKKERIDTV